MSRSLPRTIPVLPVVANLFRARAGDLASQQRLAVIQAGLLRELVRHAHAAVPFYRDRLSADAVRGVSTAADLCHLPTLDRSQVRAADPRELLAEGFTAANTRAASTSGTSGLPTTLYYSERDLGYLRATYLWDLFACGLRPFDRIGYFRAGVFRPHRLQRIGLARTVHVNTTLSIDEQVGVFLTERPSFLWGFPGVISAVVAELRRRNVRPRWVRTVMFAGECSTPAARTEVLEYLGAEGHEVYACIEAYTIARSCPLGAMHLRSADVVVEVAQENGTISVADGTDRELSGEVVVTRLHAEAMPLLRYRLGDRVRIGPNDCPCGVRSTPIVREIFGRVEDVIRTRDGRPRSGDFLLSLVVPIAGVRQVQMVQHRAGEVEAVVVAMPEGPSDLVNRLRAALAPATADFDVSVRLTDSIAPEANGKVRIVKVASHA